MEDIYNRFYSSLSDLVKLKTFYKRLFILINFSIHVVVKNKYFWFETHYIEICNLNLICI